MYYATKYREDFNEQLGKAYRRYAETIKRFQKNIWLWEGKFKVVKTENNALRKANQKLLLRVAELEKK